MTNTMLRTMMDATTSIKTPRTQLRPLEAGDAPFLYGLWNSEGWLRFIGDRGIRTLADAEAFLESRFLASMRSNGFGYFLATTRSGEALGICGFLRKPDLSHPDLGFALLPEFQGLGYGFEVALAVLDHGVTQHGLRTVQATVLETNTASIALLCRLGFRPAAWPETSTPEPGLLLYDYQVS